jgi:putative membrane protein
MGDDEPSRNDLAEDRTILANERTFGSWMRTSLASIAIGIGFQRLYGSLAPPWLPRLIATGFLLMAVLIVVLAERRASAVLQRLSPHLVASAKLVNLRLFAALISLGALALTAAIWLVD